MKTYKAIFKKNGFKLPSRTFEESRRNDRCEIQGAVLSMDKCRLLQNGAVKSWFVNLFSVEFRMAFYVFL